MYQLNASALNVAGLVANLLGVVLLFRHAMPYRLRTGGNQMNFTRNDIDQKTVKTERRFAIFGNIGLASIVLGTAAQIAATVLQ